MRLQLLSLLPFLLLLSPLAGAADKQPGAVPDSIPLPDDFDEIERTPPQTILLHRWLVNAGGDETKQIPIGMVRYSTGSKKGRYQPMKLQHEAEDDPTEYYRVGTTRAGKWVGCVVRGTDLQPKAIPEVTIRVDEEGEIWNVNYAASTSATEPTLNVVTTEVGAAPYLNKPVVLTAEGKLPDKPEEKTFFQKYWYLILGGMVLLLAGGGGEAK